MEVERSDVVVVGAGISGLACAVRARGQGLRARVYERSPRPGGVIRTLDVDGFLAEAGPNSTLDGKPAIGELIAELGIEERVVHASDAAKKRYVLRGGSLCPLPMSPPALLGSRLFSLGARLRALREPWVPRGGGEDETLAAFIERRFGREILDYAVDPFVSGVYAGDARQLGARAAFGMLVDYEREHGSVIRGAIRAARERRRAGGARPRLLSFDDGMETLPAVIADRLGEDLVLGAECTAIERREDGWRVAVAREGRREVVACRALVLAVEADAAAGLLEPLEPELAASLRRIDYAPVASVFVGYARDQIEHALDGFGFLAPSREGRSVLGAIFSSTLFPGRAPQGTVAMTAFVGGVRRPDLVELDDDQLVALVRGEIAAVLGERGAPAVLSINRWRAAIPQYAPGHERLVERLKGLPAVHGGLFVASNFVGGISVGDCIETAGAVAAEVGAHLAAA